MIEKVRLSKLMAQRGICSRREADLYIERGEVLVNGDIVSTLGTKVDPDVHIALNAKAKKTQDSRVTIMLNKPIGIVSGQPEKGYTAAIELITEENQEGEGHFSPLHRKKMAVAGRLDIDSKGLLILTQDGVLVREIIGPDSEMEKEYLVRFDGTITKEMVDQLRFGLYLDGKPLKRARVDLVKPGLLKLILKEGKNRQIRRMCDLVNLRVLWLKRIRVGPYTLGDLPEGKWMYV